jgi:hypothetical protein
LSSISIENQLFGLDSECPVINSNPSVKLGAVHVILEIRKKKEALLDPTGLGNFTVLEWNA